MTPLPSKLTLCKTAHTVALAHLARMRARVEACAPVASCSHELVASYDSILSDIQSRVTALVYRLDYQVYWDLDAYNAYSLSLAALSRNILSFERLCNSES